MEQNWREYNKQDNYESAADPCQTCKHRHPEKPKADDGGSIWTSIWFGLLVICGIVCFSFYMQWQDAESKLKNCIYYDEYNDSIHSVENGHDWTILDSSSLAEFNDLLNGLSSDDDDDW